MLNTCMLCAKVVVMLINCYKLCDYVKRLDGLPDHKGPLAKEFGSNKIAEANHQLHAVRPVKGSTCRRMWAIQ